METQISLDKAKQVLQKYFGYDSFRPAQERVIASLLSGRDTVAVMPTGAGKSLCYQIPALLLPGLTLVVSPLISLMKDQVDALTEAGIPASFINSSLSLEESNARLEKMEQGAYKLVYAAPERLETEYFRRCLAGCRVSFVAVDEAHCISQWGHDFRPSYQQIAPFIASLPKRPLVGAFTATATPEVRDDMIHLLELKNPAVHVTGVDRPNLYFGVRRNTDKKKFVLDYVKQHQGESGIIYAATRKNVDRLADFLNRHGIAAGAYHAGLSDAEREQAQNDFIYDRVQVMAATNAFGMGIDKSNVRYVIHYNMPKNLESYYQEAGRAGRDGLPGECILLYSPQDMVTQKFLIDQSTDGDARKQMELQKLRQMEEYCLTAECLRNFIIRYFGGTPDKTECGNCSSCRADTETVDITVDAQKIFSCILRMARKQGRYYGLTLLSQVLKGSKEQKIFTLGFDTLSTYGILGERTLKEIRGLVQHLITAGYLRMDGGDYPVVLLTEAVRPVLRGREPVLMKKIREQQPKKAAAEEDGLFEKLRALRTKIAAEKHVPPYVVFSDRTLRDMCRLRPRNEAEMLEVSGVGEKKWEKYGADFLNCINGK